MTLGYMENVVWHVTASGLDRDEDVKLTSDVESLVLHLTRYYSRMYGIERYTKLRELRVTVHRTGRLDSLEGLQNCPDLHTLIILNNSVEDLSPIAKLPIRCLDVSRNPVRSFSGLDLSKLETLAIDSHQLKALGEVDDLPSLTRLEIDGQVRKNHPVLKALIAKNPRLRVRMFEHRQETLQILN